MPSAGAKRDNWTGEEYSHLLDTAVRGLLGTALFAVVPFVSDIYRLWRRHAGMVPGGFGPEEFEYPPLAALYWEPISGLISARWAVVANGLIMTAAAMAITWLLVLAKHRGGYPDIHIWAASPALIFFLPIGWDTAVALVALTGVGLACFHRYRSAGALIGLGAVFKVFPGALFLPILPLLPGNRDRKRLGLTGLAVVVVSYAAYMIAMPEVWFLHIEFASGRGYWGTIWSPIAEIAGQIGLASTNDAIALLSSIAFLGALIGLTIWTASRRPTIGEAAVLATLAFLLINKVFMPQYVLWALPLMALVRVPRTLARILVYAAAVQLAYVYLPIDGAAMEIAFIARTASLVALGVTVIKRTAKRDEPQSEFPELAWS